VSPAALYAGSAACAALAAIAAAAAWWRSRPPVDDETPATWRRALAPLAARLRPTDGVELDELGRQLAGAGRRSRAAVDRFGEERAAALLAGVVGALVAAIAIGGLAGAMLAVAAAVGGVLGPRRGLAARAAARRDAVGAALPGAVDLLTTCVDAGLGLERALTRVADELGAGAPILAEELGVTARELAAGVPMADGLRRLSRRVGHDDLAALCAVLAQAHGLGAPVAGTMRDFAASSRRTRTSQLEERAGALAARITLPLAVCLLPAALLIIIGPAALQLLGAFH
jgi:tight adherence protein C